MTAPHVNSDLSINYWLAGRIRFRLKVGVRLKPPEAFLAQSRLTASLDFRLDT